MQMEIRRADQRGHADHGWLDSHHSFSFASYHDPRYMGFGHLRVINEDRVIPGEGFGTHPHRDMEIVSYVVSGALAHRDTLGTGSVIRPGEVQLMSAGKGIAHSEMNASDREPVHFLQIWILPARAGTAPRYEQRAFLAPDGSPQDGLTLVASPDGRDGSLTIGQDVDLYRALLAPGARVEPALRRRRAWVQMVHGELEVEGVLLRAGDGLAIVDAAGLRLSAHDRVEALLFDLL
ncbi:pirin family protein [Myxococcota bacterium]|nr:pirin family protein [Myxococcota bacterium]